MASFDFGAEADAPVAFAGDDAIILPSNDMVVLDDLFDIHQQHAGADQVWLA